MGRKGTIAVGAVATVVIAMIIAWIATDLQRTSANEWGCSFGKGPLDTKDLKASYGPGERGGYSNDVFVTGPSDVRFYYVDQDPETADFGARPIIVPAKGSATEGVGVVQTSTDVQVRFVINENFCKLYVGNLKRIQEITSLNYNAKTGEESGWAQFLNQSMNQKLIEATRPVLRDVDYITLYTNGKIGNESAYDVLAKELSKNLTRTLHDDLGLDYFCGPSYVFDGEVDGEFGNGCPPLEVTVKSITPTNPDLIKNLEAIVNNEEQQRKIESDTRLANEQRQADADRAVKASEEAQRQQVAEAAANEAIKVAQAEADEAIQVAQAEANREIQLAQETQRRDVEEAKASTDLTVARARAEVAQQQAANTAAAEAAKATFCVTLAEAGIRCDLLASAENGGNIIPQINLTGSADGASAATGATVVLDARP